MKFKWLILMCLAPFLSVSVFAEDEESEKLAEEVRYVELKPPFVTNYGGPGKLKYVKAEVSLRVDSQSAFRAVNNHIPFLRHTIIMVLSQQTDESVTTMEGKEQIRLQALSELQEIMKKEEGEVMIEDLLFSSFFVQR